MSARDDSRTGLGAPSVARSSRTAQAMRGRAGDLLTRNALAGRGILVVEDSRAYALRTRIMLEAIGCSPSDIRLVHDLDAALEALRGRQFAAVLCDLDLPDSRGLDTVEALLGSCGPAAVVVLSGIGNQDVAIEAVSIGAQDYVVKGRDEALVLHHVLAYSLERRRILNQLQATVEQNRRDLQAAAEVQRSLFPETLPDLPGFACAWRHVPSQLVSGDICNVMALDDRHFAWYLLDVMGHGVAAALLACQVSRLLMPGPGSMLMQGDEPRDPALLLADLNRRFQMSSNAGRFFTMVYAVVDGSTGRIRLANAGHPPVHVLRQADRRLDGLKPYGLPIGVDSGDRFDTEQADLERGDRVFCCSDGFHEVRNAAGTVLGADRMYELLRETAGLSLDRQLDALQEDSRSWADDEAVQDDRTIIAIERR